MSEIIRNGVAVLGCGTVGGGTAKILVEDSEYLKARTNIPINLKYIVDVDFSHAKAIGLPEALYEKDFEKVLNLLRRLAVAVGKLVIYIVRIIA